MSRTWFPRFYGLGLIPQQSSLVNDTHRVVYRSAPSPRLRDLQVDRMSPVLATSSIHEWIEGTLGLSSPWPGLLTTFIHAFLLINFFAVSAMAFIWMERKVAGRIQDRLGPTRVGGRFGWLQGLADGIKLIQKEDLVPPAADAMLFRMAPYLVCIASFAAFVFLPFSDGWVAVAADVGLFVIVAILSLEVFGIVLAGYSSASKWSLFGGMREAAQMVSYEIPLAICALVPIVSIGSLNLSVIARAQTGTWADWMIFHDPFTFMAFFIYFIVATAGCKRAPFDLAEAESELVGGFHTEYSGMRWSFFFMGEYASMYLVSAIAAILFLGGWHTGIPLVGLDDALISMRHGDSAALSFLANFIGMLVLVSKGVLLVFVQMWLRWTLPRLRIDQVITTCLKYFIPISCFLFLGAIFWPVVLYQFGGRTTWGQKPLGENMLPPAATQPADPGSTDLDDNRGLDDNQDAAVENQSSSAKLVAAENGGN